MKRKERLKETIEYVERVFKIQSLMLEATQPLAGTLVKDNLKQEIEDLSNWLEEEC